MIELFLVLSICVAGYALFIMRSRKFVIEAYKILSSKHITPVIEDYTEVKINGLTKMEGTFAYADKNRIRLGAFHFEWLDGELLKNIITPFEQCNKKDFKASLVKK